MQAVTHLHKPSTQLQAAYLGAFLAPHQPCLAIVKHSSVEFLALPGQAPEGSTSGPAPPPQPQPLDRVAHIDLNARVLRVSPFGLKGVQGNAPTEALAVLTDHHNPRLIVLRAQRTSRPSRDAKHLYSIRCIASIPLDEMARPPAELSLGVWTAQSSTRQLLLSHTHSGILRVVPVSTAKAADSMTEYTSRMFSAKLPHPSLISLAPLDPSSQRHPRIALLSISSTPTQLPGLGTQCLPVLSFHEVNEDRQELTPVPWGAERKVPPLVEQVSNANSPAAGPSSSGSTKAGPQAMGRTFTPEQAREREKALAKSPLTRAHVPIPFADALGAHLLTPLPASAGGGVIVWSETSILVVPPPSHAPVEAEDTATATVSASASTLPGKRRKASVSSRRSSQAKESTSSSAAPSTSPVTSLLSRSPSQTANEHGKRRRSSLKGTPLSPSSEAPHSPAANFSPHDTKILRLSLPRPIQVVAATIVREPGDESQNGVQPNGDGSGAASLTVLFATSAGALNSLQVMLSTNTEGHLYPASMGVSRIGQMPRLAGPEALRYFGEGYIYGASASGDSVVAQLVASAAADPNQQEQAVDDAEMVSPPSSPVPVRSNSKSGGIASALHHAKIADSAKDWLDLPLSSKARLEVVRRFTSLAPALDFVIDGDANAPAGGAVARVVAACGTGPDGAIAAVENGVAMQALGAIGVPDVRQLWSVPLGDSIGLVCGFADRTQILSMGAEGILDASESIGIDTSLRTLETASLGTGTAWAHVNEAGVSVFQNGQTTSWSPSNAGSKAIVSASVDTASSQVLVALQGGQVVLLSLAGAALSITATAQMPNEVSALHLAHGIAAVGQWASNTVRLLGLPDLADLTPSSMSPQDGGFGSLPRSVLVHRFRRSSSSEDTAPSLAVGLATGAVLTFTLALPTEESFSKTIAMLDKKTTALGRQPARLTPLTTTLGQVAILAHNGESASVIWAENGRVTCSAVGHPSVRSAAQVVAAGSQPALALALPDRIQLTSVGEIGQLSITKAHLGLDNPVAICGLGRDMRGLYQYFAVLTHPYRPEGSATREQRASKLIVVNSNKLEKVAEFDLETQEKANCVCTLDTEAGERIVVGTGFVNPYEAETTAGRLLLFSLDTAASRGSTGEPAHRLHLQVSEQVGGNTFAVAQVATKVLACVNSEVLSFALDADGSLDVEGGAAAASSSSSGPGSAGRLTLLSRWGCAFIACTLSPSASEPRRVVVGDALRALCVLDVDPSSGALNEVARDCDPFWTTATCALDPATQTFLGADISFNMFTCQRGVLSAKTRARIQNEVKARREKAEQLRELGVPAEGLPYVTAPMPFIEEDTRWNHVMERRGAWHYGDLVNRFREGSLCSRAAGGGAESAQASASAPAVDPRILFCTAAGAIGIISSLSPHAGPVLGEVARNLNAYLERPAPSGEATASAEADASATAAHLVLPVAAREYRTLRTDHRTSEPTAFIDGDLLVEKLAQGGCTTAERARILAGEDISGTLGPSMNFGAAEPDVDADVDVARVHASPDEVDALVEALARVC